jgi:hypothetical protein
MDDVSTLGSRSTYGGLAWCALVPRRFARHRVAPAIYSAITIDGATELSVNCWRLQSSEPTGRKAPKLLQATGT